MISVCEPTTTKNMKRYVNECLDTNWISSNGRFIKEFETKFAEYCGVKHAIRCCNGTAALHLALLALGVGKGDEVIVPDFSMIASSNAVIYTGATPIFVDSNLKTWNIDVEKIEEKITTKTKAIMIVHTYGNPVEMKKAWQLATTYGLYIIEDAAEAHGASVDDKMTGNLGHIAAFSFYANKIINTGEGGMVTTNDDELAKKVKSLKNHCFGEPRFIHNEIGYNYRMTNICAAIGLSQLEQAKALVEGRRFNAHLYNKKLKDVPGIILPPASMNNRKNVHWMYGILVDEEKFGMNKDTLMKKLYEKGIETRSFFYPLHAQPCYAYLACKEEYPNAQYLYEHGLYLPSSTHINEQQINYVVDTIKELGASK
jgi:perosamine synthetase